MYCDQASINEEYQVLVNLYKAHCSQSDAGSQVLKQVLKQVLASSLEVLSFLLKSESCCLKIESNEATPDSEAVTNVVDRDFEKGATDTLVYVIDHADGEQCGRCKIRSGFINLGARDH